MRAPDDTPMATRATGGGALRPPPRGGRPLPGRAASGEAAPRRPWP